MAVLERDHSAILCWVYINEANKTGELSEGSTVEGTTISVNVYINETNKTGELSEGSTVEGTTTSV